MFEQLREREEGFTLIELLIAITIMGVVMSGLATAFVTTVRGTNADKAAAILKTQTATSKIVARNLATAAPTVTVGANTVDMTLASFKTGYTFKFSGTTRTPGTWLTFIVGTPSPATATAG